MEMIIQTDSMDNFSYEIYDEEDTIRIRDIFFYCLRHLRQMLILGIIAMLLLGGFKGYKSYTAFKANEEENALIGSGEADTSSDIEADRAKFMKELELKSEQLTTYMKEDELFMMNPYNTYAAKATYFVDSGYKVNPYSTVQDIDYTNTLLDAYCVRLQDKDNLDNIAKKYDIKGKLSDYVTVSYNNRLLYVCVFNEDQDAAAKILHDLTDSIASIQEEINKSICSHTITFVSESIYADNEWVLSRQNDRINNVKNTLANIDALSESLESLDTEAATGSASKAFIKGFVKFGILGLIAGIILVGACYFVIFLFKDSVYSADELKDKTDIRVLGNIASDKKCSKYIALINRIEKRAAATDYNLIATSIDTFSDGTSVLLTGDVADRDVIESKLKELIKDKTLIFAGSIDKDINALKALDKCEDVIILAKCNETGYKSINEQKERLTDLNKNVIGCLVVE